VSPQKLWLNILASALVHSPAFNSITVLQDSGAGVGSWVGAEHLCKIHVSPQHNCEQKQSTEKFEMRVTAAPSLWRESMACFFTAYMVVSCSGSTRASKNTRETQLRGFLGAVAEAFALYHALKHCRHDVFGRANGWTPAEPWLLHISGGQSKPAHSAC
jgi:hypothetical protein